MGRHRVLVLNHFAVPRGEPGMTRHAELFSSVRGWDATIIAANRNLYTRATWSTDDEMFRSVPVTNYANNGPARVLNWISYAVGALAVGLRLRDLDLVYASSPHLLAGLSGCVLARIKRVPFVFEVRDLWPQVLVDMGRLAESSLQYSILRRLERFLYRHAAAIVVLAEGSRAGVIAAGGEADRVVHIPNGADPQDFSVDERRETLRASYGMDGVVFLYAGAHGPANGLDAVLDAAEAVSTTDPSIRFWLVGDGIAKQGLVTDAARRRLTNVFFHDPVPKSEIPRLLAAADIGLHVLADVPLFHYAISPNKLFDYMAAGRPVLTNTPGEVAALVQKAGAGLAVEPRGIAEGAREMAASSPAQRDAWGGNGRAFVAEHRSRETLAKQLEQLLDEITIAR